MDDLPHILIVEDDDDVIQGLDRGLDKWASELV